MRRQATDAEQILWSRLRDRQVGGAKFRRQHPIGHFIVDFFCQEAKLAIEVDGGGHDERLQANYDSERTVELESRGIKELRFWNNEVFENIEGVLEVILIAVVRASR